MRCMGAVRGRSLPGPPVDPQASGARLSRPRPRARAVGGGRRAQGWRREQGGGVGAAGECEARGPGGRGAGRAGRGRAAIARAEPTGRAQGGGGLASPMGHLPHRPSPTRGAWPSPGPVPLLPGTSPWTPGLTCRVSHGSWRRVPSWLLRPVHLLVCLLGLKLCNPVLQWTDVIYLSISGQ